MNRAATLLPVVLLSAVCVLPARAGLEFSSKEAQASPAADAESVSKEYAFTVTGGSPVTITKLESHCACLTATVSKTIWLPGEKGIVTLAMKPGGLQGEITKSATVGVRQDGKAQESELSLTVNLPKVFSFDPPVLKWEVGSPASPKTCTVKILGGNPIRLTKVHCADVNMSAQLTEVTPGKEYLITATPVGTAAKGIGVVEIQTDAISPRHRTQQVIYTLTAPKKAGK